MPIETEPVREWASRRGVRASAGSGKTYDLTGHYLRWLLRGAEPSAMLATTFTKKAAGEILGRVMNRLAEACSSEEKRKALAIELALEGMTLDQARPALARLCQALHQVSIGTIDSFFGRLIRTLRHELGLPADTRILDGASPEIARVRRDCVAQVLAADNQADLISLLVDLNRGKASQRVASDLAQALASAHEIFQMSPPGAWEAVSVPPGLLEPAGLREAARNLDESCSYLRDRRQRQAAERELGLISAAEWEALLGAGIAGKVAAGQTSYYSPLPEEVVRAYEPIVAHARAAVLSRHVAHTRALYRLLTVYDQAYAEISARERVLVFSDVPLRLARLLASRSASEVARRLDCEIEHLLLDEFQDTDPEQYAVLKPFADSIHALPRSRGLIYCVGDLKQSIYGWRGATPQIFERFGIDLPDVEWTDNDTSYRSAQAVLDSVNALFGNLAENAVLREKHQAVAEQWQSRFHPHRAKKDLAGFVQLLQSPGAVDEEAEAAGDEAASTAPADPHMEFAANTIKEIAERAPWATVGVLMRSGNAARRMIFLLNRLGVTASAEGGSPIAADPAVSIILSALAFADHPADTAARFHVLNSPLAELIGLIGEKALPPAEAALAIRRQLMERGYAAVLSEWASHLRSVGSWDRLLAIIELADEYDRRPGLRPADFARLARAQSVEETRASPVRLMTIHKAKGLEFDSVVLPELQMALMRAPALVYSRDPQTLRINAVSSYPSRVVRALDPVLAAMYEDFHAQEMREALCLLYVAMTRARQSLTIIVPSLERKQDGSAGKARFSLASIARAGLAGEESLADLDLPAEIYAHGDPEWYRHQPERADVSPPPALGRADLPAIDPKDYPRRARRQITPSSLAEEPLDLASEAARHRGVALHAMLAQIEWAGEPVPADEQLLGAARLAAPGSSDAEIAACLPVFHGLLAKPAVRQALARPTLAVGERAELWRERDFLQLIDGDLVSGTFDRVVLVYAGDTLRSARIFDFKTMECDLADLPALVEKYRPQVELYRRALSAMIGSSPSRISAEIVFTAVGESVTI